MNDAFEDLQTALRQECYGKDLTTRKRQYSDVAAAYHQVRPRYPASILNRVSELAKLSSTSRILEVGCGPAIATLPMAQRGYHVHAIEPNPEFYTLAQQDCAPFANVTLENCAFEEWTLRPNAFDTVLGASSFHWIPPAIAYGKAAAALKPDGHLILLWNKELQPTQETFQRMGAAYEKYVPQLHRRYEDQSTQVEILNTLGAAAIATQQFHAIASGWVEVNTTYSVDQYLQLLSTYSPHIRLSPQQKTSLFAELRRVLSQLGDTVALSHISAFHLYRPCGGSPV